MSRRTFRKPAITLPLFTFLAVLVCTMGALIVLLVCVLQKAHGEAADLANSRQSTLSAAEQERLEELQLEKEDQEWRRSELERQRTEFQQKLTQQRLTLSHFEDHIRQLEEQFKQLSAQAEGLTKIGSQESVGSDELQNKLQSLRTEIEQQREQLAETQRQAAGKKRSFAIIPYDGPNGTKRRPIYIECTDQGIVLQPEGVLLTPNDFVGSLGPGNPLDAALRTTREYLAKYETTMSQGEPYPLLVVRPNGTMAYAAARAALKSWDDEFGYELVEEDLKLVYPKPDPALAQELHRSITDARQRQEVLTAIMPGRFKQSGATGLVASSSGGFTAVGGSSTSGKGGGSASSGPGPGGDPAGGGSFSRSFRGAGLGPEDRATSMQAAQRYLAESSGNRSSGRTAGGLPGGGPAGGGLPGGGAPGNSQPGGGYPGGSPSGSGGGYPGGGNSGGKPGANGQTSSGTPNSNGGQNPNGDSMSPNSNSPAGPSSPFGQPGLPGASKQFADGSVSDASSNAAGGQPNRNGKSRGPAHKAPIGMEPIANSRGSDWGLPNRGATTTGIQRYLQIECQPDRLVLLQDRTDYRNPAVIAMAGETNAAIDPLMSAIWKRMEQWGLAADGCYWKPVLRVQVHPDAEQRFAELSKLLDYSGIVVERKN